MSYLEDNARSGRVLLPDLVRACALLGIILVNVAYFAYPGDITYHENGLRNGWDHAAYFSVNALFLFKSYTLFSFMFGVGLAHQMIAADRHSTSFGPAYWRRLIGLILLGALHITLAFTGDVLLVYGVLGMILYFFRNAGIKTLVRTGIALVVLQVVIATLFSLGMYSAETQDPELWATIAAETNTERANTQAIFGDGSFAEVAARRWYEWRGIVKFILPLQAPGALGFFLIGLAAVRAGLLADPNAALWARSRKLFLPIGLFLSILGTWVYTMGNGFSWIALLAYAILLLAAPFSSLGYIGLIAKWSRGPVTRFKVFVARGGSASLTAYLLQSVILSLLFCGYGLGLYQKPGAMICVIIAITTGIFTITVSSLLRARYKRGPLEYLLRYWTYLGQR